MELPCSLVVETSTVTMEALALLPLLRPLVLVLVSVLPDSVSLVLVCIPNEHR